MQKGGSAAFLHSILKGSLKFGTKIEISVTVHN